MDQLEMNIARADHGPVCAIVGRQTIDRIRHPNRGNGFAIWDNGPSFFRADRGQEVAMPISAGGVSSGLSVWRLLDDPDHGTVHAPVVALGDVHRRRWSRRYGSGWLVSLGRGSLRYRFDADNGERITFRAVTALVGTPTSVRRNGRAVALTLEPSFEERRWQTYVMVGGKMIAFRDEVPARERSVASVYR